MKVALEMDGMSCNHCRMAVDQALEQVSGVESKEVGIGTAVITTSDWNAIRARVEEVLEEEGYPLRKATSTAD
ncbi:MAG: heavy-metal-associated domain-containing protein [Bacteroidetes bacterium]|nr:heavy-metal-associated domain-containing protein [Bacteroidota bacterium]MDA0875104.1 heavy-metal-associated domain-containing protein [Bacteroidota bacterium]